MLKIVARKKRSSLFLRRVGNGEKRFYEIVCGVDGTCLDWRSRETIRTTTKEKKGKTVFLQTVVIAIRKHLTVFLSLFLSLDTSLCK
jgi:hypothetical protein